MGATNGTRDDPDTLPDTQRLRVRLAKRVAQVGRWESVNWEVASVEPCADPAPPPGEHEYDLTLALYRDEAEDYRHNLGARQPRLFVICTREVDDRVVPARLTLSQGDAASHLEIEDEVLDCPLPERLCDWVAAYLVLVPLPARKGKRRFRDKSGGAAS